MALRILFILLGFVIVVNLVITGVGLLLGVNLYQKYSKEILNFFTIAVLLIILMFVLFSFIGLN